MFCQVQHIYQYYVLIIHSWPSPQAAAPACHNEALQVASSVYITFYQAKLKLFLGSVVSLRKTMAPKGKFSFAKGKVM